MGDGRRLFDDLQEVVHDGADLLRDGVDALETRSAREIDRWAERGVEGARRLGKELESELGSPRARRKQAVSRARQARRSEQDAKQADKAERRADKAARKAARAAAKLDRSRHRGRRRRKERDADLSPEEREHRAALRRARRRANQRIGFLTHFGSYLATLGLLFVTTRSVRIVLIVGLGWGIGVFSHYLWSIVAPRARDRWVEAEVGARSAKRVRRERKQVETRSRRSLEDLSASIAHEIRNPITAAKSLVQQMGEDPAAGENLAYAGLALSELDRVERSISHLLRYARDEEPRMQPTTLRAIAVAASEGLRDRAKEHGVTLGFEFEGEGELTGDPEKLRRVVENLIANAVDAISEAGTEAGRIDLIGGESLAGDAVWLRIVDDGPGIPAEERERIWSPFFTTKESGTGLGLALSRKTIEAHGGRIELLSDPRVGSEFILTFPKREAVATAEAN